MTTIESGRKRGGAARFAKRGRRGGFTLVEVAVSLLVVAVGFTAILSIFPVGMEWTRESLYKGGGLQGARNIANAFLVYDHRDNTGYGLNKALMPGKKVDSDSGGDYFGHIYEAGGFFFTVEYKIRAENGTWSADWVANPTPAGLYTALIADGNAAGAGGVSGHLDRRTGRMVRIRVQCYRQRPASGTTMAAKDLLGTYERMCWIVPA